MPLLLVGLLDYIRSIRALEDVIASNTAIIAEEAGAELRERYSGVAISLDLLAENTAAATILRRDAKSSANSASIAFLQQLRDATRRQFAWVVYRDSSLNPIASFDAAAQSAAPTEWLYVATLPVRDTSARQLGHVDAAVRMGRTTRRGFRNHDAPTCRHESRAARSHASASRAEGKMHSSER